MTYVLDQNKINIRYLFRPSFAKKKKKTKSHNFTMKIRDYLSL